MAAPYFFERKDGMSEMNCPNAPDPFGYVSTAMKSIVGRQSSRGRSDRSTMLRIDTQRCLPDGMAVALRGLRSDMTATLKSLQRFYQSVLSVRVVEGDEDNQDIAKVAGRYKLLGDSLVFVPHFRFEPGRLYRAHFTPPHGPAFDNCSQLSQDIRVSVKATPCPKVLAVFPSGEQLPENLLRFYVEFSESMRRGKAEAQISIQGPDGSPISDILYRAPVELWDPKMCCLTVLLDPGRLKRGVGPTASSALR